MAEKTPTPQRVYESEIHSSSGLRLVIEKQPASTPGQSSQLETTQTSRDLVERLMDRLKKI